MGTENELELVHDLNEGGAFFFAQPGNNNGPEATK